MIILAILGWFIVGVIWVKFRENGWLIMITNPLNSRRTWMALPALLLTWTFWPVCNQVARTMFLLSR